MKHVKQTGAELSAATGTTGAEDRNTDELTGQYRLCKSIDGHRAIMDWYKDAVATIDTPVSSRYVSTRFGRTHMLAAGPDDAPALILIPGIAGCAPLWRRQLPAFAQHFRVYALDIVGQPGKSEPETPSFLNDDFSLWLLDVLDGLGIERAHFAGTSVGGWIVLRFAIHSPERVDKIVLLSPTGIARARLPIRIWVTKFLDKRKSPDALQDDLTARSVTNKSPGASFGTFDRRLAKLMALCTRHYRIDRSMGIYNPRTRRVDFWSGLQVLRKFFLSEPRALLRRLRVPSLLILGEHERLYNPEQVARRARKLLAGVETDIIAGAGHAAIYDKPDEVNTRVLDYLRG